MVNLLLCIFGALVIGAELTPNLEDSAGWKIIGGSRAPAGLYPYLVSIQTFNRHHICGGSIIHQNWIVTAAHCVLGAPKKLLKISAGSNRLSDFFNRIFLKVIEIHVHERFDEQKFLNDIALLKVRDIKFDENVSSIAVGKFFLEEDKPVVLSGWGSTFVEGPVANNLQHVRLLTTSWEQCRKAHTREIRTTQLCTITEDGFGACHGDSGGPLVMLSQNGTNYLVGIVSWGCPCARQKPDVFTRLSSFIEWLNQKCSNCI